MNNQSNIVYLEKIRLETQIDVSASNSIANDPALAVYEAVVAMKQKMDALDAFVKEGIEVLKQFMDDKEVLISKDGRRLATWEQQKERLVLDADALKKNFADIYDICLVKKPGNKPFLLK